MSEPTYHRWTAGELREKHRWAPSGPVEVSVGEGEWSEYSETAADFYEAMREALPALLDDLAASQQRERTASEAYHRQQGAQRELEALYQKAVEEREALRVALQGLLQVAWHDDDCAHVTRTGPCDCGFTAASLTAERLLPLKEEA